MTLFLLVLTLCMAGYFLAWTLAEHSGSELAERYPALDRKPFNCLPCLSFLLIWILQGIAALLLRSMAFFAAGLACAFIVFAVLYFASRNKIEP
jgi:hypothetical protein